MALSKASLQTKILAELTGQGFNVAANGRDDGNWMNKFALAIANAVVDEIQSNAVATGTDSRGDSHSLPIS
jgi:hypothetical protein